MEEIRSWWEVPCVAHYCSIFEKAFKLPQIEIEELEDALLLDSSPSKLLVELFCLFLNGIVDKEITNENWEFFLKLHFEWRCEHLGQKWNPFSGGKDYKDLSRRQKIEILHKLCHWRLELDDIADLLRGVDGPSLRVYPLGKDTEGNTYWHFFGMRLYKEEPKRRKKKETVKETPPAKRGRGRGGSTPRKPGRGRGTPGRSRGKKGDDDQTPGRQTKGRGNNGKGQCEDGNDDDRSEVASEDLESEPSVSVTGWSVVCYNLEEWTQLTESFAGVKLKDVKCLYNNLTELLPHIEYLSQVREREDKKKLLASLPRRTSDRIAVKAAEKEELDKLMALDREFEREEMRKINAEEQRQADEEAEKKRQERREEALQRRKAREEQQAKQREAEEENWEKAMSGELTGRRKAAIGASKSVSEVTLLGEQLLAEEKNDMYTAMFKILGGLRNQEDSWVFDDPVTEAIAPGYFEVVDKPMDYSTVEKRIESHHYKDREEFVSDIELIYSNCIEYNGEESEYTELASEMKNILASLQRVHFDGEPENDVDDDDVGARKKKGRNKSHSPSPDLTSESSGEEESDDSDVSYEEGLLHKKKNVTKELTTRNILKLPPGFDDKLGALRPPRLPPQMNPNFYHQLMQQRMQAPHMLPRDGQYPGFAPRLPPPYPGPAQNGPLMRPPMYRPNPDMRHMYPGMYPDGRPMYPVPPHHPMAQQAAYQQMLIQRSMAQRHRHSQSPRQNTGTPVNNSMTQRQSSSPSLLPTQTDPPEGAPPASAPGEQSNSSGTMTPPHSTPAPPSGSQEQKEVTTNTDERHCSSQSPLRSQSTSSVDKPLTSPDRPHPSQPDPRQQRYHAEQYERYRQHMMMAMQQRHQHSPPFPEGGYGYPPPPIERTPEEMAYYAWHQQQGGMYHQEMDYMHQQQQRYWQEMELRQRHAYEMMMRQRSAQQGAPHSSDQAEGGNQATTQNGQTDTKPTHRPMSQEGIPPTHRPYPFDGPPSMNGSMDRGDYHHRVPYPPNGHHQYPPRPPFFSSNPQQHRLPTGPEGGGKRPNDLSPPQNGEQGPPAAKRAKTESEEQS